MKFSEEELNDIFDAIRYLNDQDFEGCQYLRDILPYSFVTPGTTGLKIEVEFYDKKMFDWIKAYQEAK